MLALLPLHPVRSILSWPVASQARSRRNALVANTALAARRAEREEVDRYLDDLTSGRITA